MREFIYCAKAGCRNRADIKTGHCPQHRHAQGIEARSDETPKAAQPVGREPGPKDAPDA